MPNWGVLLWRRVTPFFKLKIENIVETRQCDHKNKHTLTRLVFLLCRWFYVCELHCFLRRINDDVCIRLVRFYIEMTSLTRLYRGAAVKKNDLFFLHGALGIAAASFASVREMGFGNGDLGIWRYF